MLCQYCGYTLDDDSLERSYCFGMSSDYSDDPYETSHLITRASCDRCGTANHTEMDVSSDEPSLPSLDYYYDDYPYYEEQSR